jgi:uncharacterized protein DUF3422
MPATPQPSNPSAILHRRPAYAVNSPAVLCHQCYRLDDVAKSESPLLSATRRNIATIRLNAVLFRIQTAGRSDAETSDIFVFRLTKLGRPRTPAEEAEAKRLASQKREFDALCASHSKFLCDVDSQRTILSMLPVVDSASHEWNGWRARMRVDLHSEFYSVTFILDRALDNIGGAGTAEAGVAGQTPSPASIPLQPGDSPGYVDEWYEGIWTRFFASLARAGAGSHFPCEKFNECRGLVLEMPTEPAAPIDEEPRPRPHHDPIVDLLRAEQRADDRKKRLYGWLNDHLDLVREILQFDKLYRQKDQDANCVLCAVLQGWGIYASSLGQVESVRRGGPRDPATAADDAAAASFEPDRYLILHDGIARFQLGRLLRRLHVLDELRCAAVFDFPALIGASERIRTLGNEIDRQLHIDDVNRDKSALTREALAEVQAQLNELTATAVDGGLLYRINRSRYYAQDFKLRMSDMFIERIDGWEPYDIFMHRNLFPILDHIDNIGRRFDALAARVERLTDARNVEELVNVESEIAYIQSIGEIIGWTAFAYYFSQILSKILHPLCTAIPCLSQPYCESLANHDTAMTPSVIIAGLTAILLGVGFRNRWFGKMFGRAARSGRGHA